MFPELSARLHTAATVFCALLCVVLSTSARAVILAEGQLLTPLAPSSPGKELRLLLTSPLDPAKPVWAAYQIIALSASDAPKGEIIMEASLEGVPVDIKELKVVFMADRLEQSRSAGTIGTLLEEQSGKRSPQELTESMGPELYAAFQALNEQRGTILQGMRVRTYQPPGNPEALLMVSVDSASGIHPLLLKVTVGQGDMPPDIAAAAETRFSPSTLAGGVLALFLVMAWFRWRR